MTAPFQLPPPDRVLLRDGALVLRPLVNTDADALWCAAQAEDIGLYTSIEWPFTPDAARRLIADARRDWLAGSAARFAIVDELVPGGLLAGTASLLHIYPERSDAELGYWLGPQGRGRGLARRAVTLLSDWAFAELGLRRLHLGVDFPNDASHAVALGAGYTPAGEEQWRHPTDPSKDAVLQMYERLNPR